MHKHRWPQQLTLATFAIFLAFYLFFLRLPWSTCNVRGINFGWGGSFEYQVSLQRLNCTLFKDSYKWIWLNSTKRKEKSIFIVEQRDSTGLITDQLSSWIKFCDVHIDCWGRMGGNTISTKIFSTPCFLHFLPLVFVNSGVSLGCTTCEVNTCTGS